MASSVDADNAASNPTAASTASAANDAATEGVAGEITDRSKHRGSVVTLVGPFDFHFGELVVEEYPELTVPRLCLRCNKKPMDDEGIVKLCKALDVAFGLRRPLTI